MLIPLLSTPPMIIFEGQNKYPHFKTRVMANKFGFSFSWKRALGITSAKQKFAKSTGIPTTKAGLEKKIGSSILQFLFGKK